MTVKNLILDKNDHWSKLVPAILTIFFYESLFSERNNMKNSIRNILSDDSNLACILLKISECNANINFLRSKMQQHK